MSGGLFPGMPSPFLLLLDKAWCMWLWSIHIFSHIKNFQDILLHVEWGGACSMVLPQLWGQNDTVTMSSDR